MNWDQLKIGDVVMLTAGGPRMTVSFVDECNVSCCWFDGGELKRAGFKPEILTMAVTTVPKAEV